MQLLPLVATFLGAFFMMFWLDPAIALLAALLLPVYYLAMKLIGRRIRPITAAWIKSWSTTISLVQENLSLLLVIKAFIREPLEAQRFEKRNIDLLTWSKRKILIQSALSAAISLLAGVGLLLVLWIGLGHIESGRLEASSLVSLLLYAMLLNRPVSGLSSVYGSVMTTRGAAERLLELFAARPEPVGENLPPMKEVK